MFRRVVTAISTSVVAIFLLLAVPFAQLRLPVEKPACCCPDPELCKCPDHNKAKAPDEARMKACHKSPTSAVVVEPLPVFQGPPAVAFAPPAFVALPVVDILRDPHASPPPRRPDAPS